MSHKIVIIKYIKNSFWHDALYALLYVYAKFQVEMSYAFGRTFRWIFLNGIKMESW